MICGINVVPVFFISPNTDNALKIVFLNMFKMTRTSKCCKNHVRSNRKHDIFYLLPTLKQDSDFQKIQQGKERLRIQLEFPTSGKKATSEFSTTNNINLELRKEYWNLEPLVALQLQPNETNCSIRLPLYATMSTQTSTSSLTSTHHPRDVKNLLPIPERGQNELTCFKSSVRTL